MEQPLSSHLEEVAYQTSGTLAEQILKNKEKSLNQKERKLKDDKKKIHLNEISLADQIDQNEYSKAYNRK